MAAKSVIWFLIIITTTSAQKLRFELNSSHSFCESITCKSLNCLKGMKNCVVILKNLEVSVMETAQISDFANLTFPLLREVIGFVMVYRVQGLESLGQLFPNLVRIRGKQLVNNYALTIFEMPSLTEIGLYSLRKIDRGGVILRGLPQACYMDTIDWKTIAPRARHVIDPSDQLVKRQCKNMCTCSLNATYNHCWNNIKCQYFADGFEDDVKCNEQCLGCRMNDLNECSLCRHYTYNGECMPRCPNGTIVLDESQYCLTEKECQDLNGWAFNNTCVFNCPADYVVENSTHGNICRECAQCQETCPEQKIRSLGSLQAAQKCVYVNGSLEIHIRAIPEAVKELRLFLRRLQEVADYVEIYGSHVITSLDFLSSLNHIKGRKLKNDKYSLIIYDMANLHSLFTPEVMKRLKIDRGTIKIYNNPMLCMSKVDDLKPLLPIAPSKLDVPQDTNGYVCGCKQVPVHFEIIFRNETSVILLFSPIKDPNIQYTVLYVRIPPGLNSTVVPETCSDFQWFSVKVSSIFGDKGITLIDSLKPASSYAVCIETYDPVEERLARSNILNFTTLPGIPKPPFLIELVADSHDLIVLRWVNHVDYIRHITHYQLDVALIESRDITSIDYCMVAINDFKEVESNRHAVVMRPPPDYERACESMCGVLSSYPMGALVEDFFDVCDFDFDCSTQEDVPLQNTNFKNYVKTLSLNFNSSHNSYQVGGLAPYRDYRFRLRACIGLNCSRSASGVVRTKKFPKADYPVVTNGSADETGNVVIKWDPPNVTNGPVLANTVEILPKYDFDTVHFVVLPQTWCVSPNTLSVAVSCVIAPEYTARICTMTLASISACSDWYKIPVKVVSHIYRPPRITWYWWMAVTFGLLFLLYIVYLLINRIYKKRPEREDLVPIVDLVFTESCTEY